MRWKLYIGGLAFLLATVGGCKQPVFMTVDQLEEYKNLMPAYLENNPKAGAQPLIAESPIPSTVNNPSQRIRPLPLCEAIATALEKGTVGNPTLLFQLNSQLSFGVLGGATSVGYDPLNDQSIQFTGQGLSGGTDNPIRILRLDPANVGADLELALSRFDAVWSTSFTWNNTDQPVATPAQLAQTAGTTNTIVQQDVTAATGIYKPLPTGGIAGITFSTDYTYTNIPAVPVNPSYRPDLQFSFEQPLLAGFGTEINQIRNNTPGTNSLLNPLVFNNGLFAPPSAEGILITRVRFDEQRAEFERNLNYMVMNVEIAYWNLYNAYWSMYSAEQAVRQAYEAWKISLAAYQAGRIAIGDLAQARGTYEQFRGNRLLTLQTVLDAERSLRGLMGLPMDDGCRIIPIDSPTLAPYQPDWDTSWQECMANLPELNMAREEVKARQMYVIAAKNALLPDLRLTATYDMNSLGSQLDGGGSNINNAFGQLASDHFNNWNVGLHLNVPIGFRAAQANLRMAQLQLARSYEFLHYQELKAERILGEWFRRLSSSYELIRIRRAQREAFAEQLKARFQEFLAGREKVTIDRLLDAQRLWADALATEYVAIRDYNVTIVAFEAARGTNLQRNNVLVAEGTLPPDARKRAVEHERQREHAIPVMERALPDMSPPTPVSLDQMPAPVPLGSTSLNGAPTGTAGTPDSMEVGGTTSPDRNPSLLKLWEKNPPLLDPPTLPPVTAFPGPGTASIPAAVVRPAETTSLPLASVRNSTGPEVSNPTMSISTQSAPPVSMGKPQQSMPLGPALQP